MSLQARTFAGLLGFRLWLVTERTGLTKRLDVNEGPVDLCADAMPPRCTADFCVIPVCPSDTDFTFSSQ